MTDMYFVHVPIVEGDKNCIYHKKYDEDVDFNDGQLILC